MKKILLFLMLTISTLSFSQELTPVEFSKFKLQWFQYMGIRGGSGSQSLKSTFVNTSNKIIKYIVVHYYPVNNVFDIVEDNYHRYDFYISYTGPFEVGAQYSMGVEIALFYPNLLIAYPYKVDVTYMDNTKDEIEIDDSKIKKMFINIFPIKIGNINDFKNK